MLKLYHHIWHVMVHKSRTELNGVWWMLNEECLRRRFYFSPRSSEKSQLRWGRRRLETDVCVAGHQAADPELIQSYVKRVSSVFCNHSNCTLCFGFSKVESIGSLRILTTKLVSMLFFLLKDVVVAIKRSLVAPCWSNRMSRICRACDWKKYIY